MSSGGCQVDRLRRCVELETLRCNRRSEDDDEDDEDSNEEEIDNGDGSGDEDSSDSDSESSVSDEEDRGNPLSLLALSRCD